MRMVSIFLICGLGLALSSSASEAGKEELQAQAAFKKAFASTIPTSRRAAFKLLANYSHPTTCQMLLVAATQDTDRTVRYSAFQFLLRVPSRDGVIEKSVAQAFRAQPKTDQGIRVDMSKLIAESKLEFKTELAGVISEFLWQTLRYPESYTVDNNPNSAIQNNNPDAARNFALNQRKWFEETLAALNKVTETGISASGKASGEVKKWFQENQARLMKADAELLAKNKKEDAEKAKVK